MAITLGMRPIGNYLRHEANWQLPLARGQLSITLGMRPIGNNPKKRPIGNYLRHEAKWQLTKVKADWQLP